MHDCTMHPTNRNCYGIQLSSIEKMTTQKILSNQLINQFHKHIRTQKGHKSRATNTFSKLFCTIKHPHFQKQKTTKILLCIYQMILSFFHTLRLWLRSYCYCITFKVLNVCTKKYCMKYKKKIEHRIRIRCMANRYDTYFSS